jgi:hypothetical protein
MVFDNIAYLQYGNTRQQQAYSVLTGNQIMTRLKRFDPILVGTIPIGIDIESSDLDVICCFANRTDFLSTIVENFVREEKFVVREQNNLEVPTIVSNFFAGGFQIEIFAQSTPTREQFAYRHLIVEHYLLSTLGEEFRRKIVELKRQGYKTEPAFAMALGLTGDPYTELLRIEIKDAEPRT